MLWCVVSMCFLQATGGFAGYNDEKIVRLDLQNNEDCD